MPRWRMLRKTISATMRSVSEVLNTHFFTGSTIEMAPAIVMNGTSACSTNGIIDIAAPLIDPPMMTSTWSLASSRLVNEFALLTSLVSS